jgi:hypothetical protein
MNKTRQTTIVVTTIDEEQQYLPFIYLFLYNRLGTK